MSYFFFFFFSSRRRHTRFKCDWSSDVCSSDLFVRVVCAPFASRSFLPGRSGRLCEGAVLVLCLTDRRGSPHPNSSCIMPLDQRLKGQVRLVTNPQWCLQPSERISRHQEQTTQQPRGRGGTLILPLGRRQLLCFGKCRWCLDCVSLLHFRRKHKTKWKSSEAILTCASALRRRPI